MERMIFIRDDLDLNWREDLMTRRAALYSDHIYEHAPLDTCVGYMDFSKQKVFKLGGHNRNQRALLNSHRHFWCLELQTVLLDRRSTPDGLIFHLWGQTRRTAVAMTRPCTGNPASTQ